MKKKKLIDTELYYEKLDNGLDIYIVPKHDINNIYVTYNSKYGGKDNEFVPINETKMHKFPDGIAHFLEHKLFEQEDGTNIFGFYSERGANSNANTNYQRTSYLFWGTSFFEDNLECLLNYVQSPYFTDENVLKEKGIIEQEIKMIDDDPYRKLFNGCLENAFLKLPYNKAVIGDIKSIRSITKDDLYRCYNTFYHPSNMFMVITGNIDPDKVLKQIKDNQDKRTLSNFDIIKRKKYDEPDKVNKKEERVKMNVSISKIALGYKINRDRFREIDSKMATRLIYTIFDLKVGSTSILSENLRKENILTVPVSTIVFMTESHYLVIFLAETKKEKKYLKEIEFSLKDLNITPTEFERRKKTMINNLILSTESIFSTNDRIVDNIVDYNKVYCDELELVKNLSMKDLNYVINNITLENNFKYIIDPK